MKIIIILFLSVVQAYSIVGGELIEENGKIVYLKVFKQEPFQGKYSNSRISNVKGATGFFIGEKTLVLAGHTARTLLDGSRNRVSLTYKGRERVISNSLFRVYLPSFRDFDNLNTSIGDMGVIKFKNKVTDRYYEIAESVNLKQKVTILGYGETRKSFWSSFRRSYGYLHRGYNYIRRSHERDFMPYSGCE